MWTVLMEGELANTFELTDGGGESDAACLFERGD